MILLVIDMQKGIVDEETSSTFDNDYMTGETAVRYYNEDVWEELVDTVTFEEAIDLLGDGQLSAYKTEQGI